MYYINNDLVESDSAFCKPDFQNLKKEVIIYFIFPTKFRMYLKFVYLLLSFERVNIYIYLH